LADIVAEVLTDGNVDDAKTALDLIGEVEGDITSTTASRLLATDFVLVIRSRRKLRRSLPATS
jgi:hypothetical protein